MGGNYALLGRAIKGHALAHVRSLYHSIMLSGTANSTGIAFPVAIWMEAIRTDNYIRLPLTLLPIWDYGELTPYIPTNQCLTIGAVISFDQEVSPYISITKTSIFNIRLGRIYLGACSYHNF